ncbi:two-component response regulator ARR2-like isoform X1 [Hibiscus syriacus]|uniref:Two-component response regulator ARR2-like isoform X1 n=1 Tax=Hibiscus syriacus TaxID=106335 RepID=A0A6A2Y013_HIBSY|nr:uncharacterized protein LOC120183285 [Hibiscus syriacus]KAE8664619.1 two-component response regulator ARR2-like isoform X1 [Hibiscus syriacus]
MAETHTKMAYTILTSPMLPFIPKAMNSLKTDRFAIVAAVKALKLRNYQRASHVSCASRRRIRYEQDDDEDEGENEYNEEIAILEVYSQSAREEALIVHALVDEQQVEVLIFKGFSSCLSYETSPDPSKSVIPRRAVINSIDRIKGPFDPSNIQYIEKGLQWESFKARLAST